MLDIANWFQCLHFPGGLTQSDWFGLVQGTVGTGLAAATYNQAAYVTNVGLRQAQLYQEKNYHLAWAALAREDVREMMSISVNRINNYMLVATLIMAVAADALFFVQEFDQDCPGFVRNAFWLSMGLSIAFFALSIMFGIKGQNSAFVNTMRLLTWEMRPENPAPYDYDYMAQAQKFEKDGIRSLMRLPGMSAKYPHAKGVKAAAIPDVLGRPHPGGSEGQKEDLGQQPGLEQIEPRTRELVYLSRFAHYMQMWMPYESNSKYCIGLGLITLAQGGAYFSLGVLSWGKTGFGYILACVMIAIFVYITLMVYTANYKAKNSYITVLVIVLFCWGPVAAALGSLVDNIWMARVFAPLTCLGQSCLYFGILLVSFSEARTPTNEAQKYTEGPHGQIFSHDWKGAESSPQMQASLRGQEAPGSHAFARHGLPEGNKDAPTVQEKHEEESQAWEVQERAIRTVRLTLCLSGSLWLLLLIVEILTAVPAAPAASNTQASLPGVLELQEVPMKWPRDAVRLKGLACAGSEVFVANRYQVFRSLPDRGTVVAEPCGLLPAPIADVAVACNQSVGHCWPLLLLQSGKVVDCAARDAADLMQESLPAQRFVVQAARMLALHDRMVVEYRRESQGWQPRCERAEVASSGALNGALDVEGDSLLLFQSAEAGASGLLEVQGLESSKESSWSLRPGHGRFVSGCATGGSVWILTDADSRPSLWKTKLPAEAL